mmetsp:Transcript_24715/g.76895  ORF Transcript_24715/g.76895 Transcript_24715/m.76895 type:complete len:240 (+) Transcript_24715:261-980(+)
MVGVARPSQHQCPTRGGVPRPLQGSRSHSLPALLGQRQEAGLLGALRDSIQRERASGECLLEPRGNQAGEPLVRHDGAEVYPVPGGLGGRELRRVPPGRPLLGPRHWHAEAPAGSEGPCRLLVPDRRADLELLDGPGLPQALEDYLQGARDRRRRRRAHDGQRGHRLALTVARRRAAPGALLPPGAGARTRFRQHPDQDGGRGTPAGRRAPACRGLLRLRRRGQGLLRGCGRRRRRHRL